MEEIIESYINGNISWVKEQMTDNNISLSELLTLFIEMENPDNEAIILFIVRLENK